VCDIGRIKIFKESWADTYRQADLINPGQIDSKEKK
jgi:hypothetical protein